MYGTTSPWFYGLDAGFFRDEGIDATVDGGTGSAEAITRVAGGAYDYGNADISAILEFETHNPGLGPKLIMPLTDRYPAAVFSLKAKGITKLADLKGKKLGMASTDAGSRLFPAVLRRANIDGSDIQIISIDVKLRDSLLLRGQVDAVIGFDYTTLFNLYGVGVKPDDINLIYFSDNGFNLYGQGLIASRARIRDNPDQVRGMARAAARTWIAAVHDPKLAIDAIMKRDGLADRDLEASRLKFFIDRYVLTDNVKANGIGAMDVARLQDGMKIVAEGFGLPAVPPVTEIYDDRFMPSAAARKIA